MSSQEWIVIKDCQFFGKRCPETGKHQYNTLTKGTTLIQVPISELTMEERKTLKQTEARRKDNAKLIKCLWQGIHRTLAVGVDIIPASQNMKRPRPRK